VSEHTPDDIFKLVKDENIEYVDVRFCDLPGTMQHFTIPIYVFDQTVFEEGLAFDGSSIRGFQSIPSHRKAGSRQWVVHPGS
jgi:glutamine synthetase